MDLRKFRDLMASEEIYFRRADLLTDRSEGLPPEDYALRVLGLDPFNIDHRRQLNNLDYAHNQHFRRWSLLNDATRV
jgi:hypothetical protein